MVENKAELLLNPNSSAGAETSFLLMGILDDPGLLYPNEDGDLIEDMVGLDVDPGDLNMEAEALGLRPNPKDGVGDAT